MRLPVWMLATCAAFMLCATACQPQHSAWMSNSTHHGSYQDSDARDLHICPHVGDMNELC